MPDARIPVELHTNRRRPAARVVRVDDDPIVRAHAGWLPPGDGTTARVTADTRDPRRIADHPEYSPGVGSPSMPWRDFLPRGNPYSKATRLPTNFPLGPDGTTGGDAAQQDGSSTRKQHAGAWTMAVEAAA